MKKIQVLILFFVISFSLKSQPTCTSFQLLTDLTHYNVLPTTDSAFVKYIQFDLTDTTALSKVKFTLTDLATGNQIQKQYNLNSQTLQDLTVANNWARVNKNVKISLGYLKYLRKNYAVNIKLYDVSNNLLSDSNFNFSH